MCLVLGTPGSGCTTFLKAIANERQGYYHVGGDVRYAGIDSQEMVKSYKGELVYNAEGVSPACLFGLLNSTNTLGRR
jgi:ATP-binding cassette, subfamily G (WHITE), member 2, SNQ2